MKTPRDKAVERKDAPRAAAPRAKSDEQALIGVVLLKGTWPMFGFFKEALQGIQRVAFSQGYGIVLVNPAPLKELDIGRVVGSLRGTLAGLLFVAPPETQLPFLTDLAREGYPVVALYRRFRGVSYAGVDNEGGAFAAVEHLVGLGHERIAFLNGPADAVDAQERLAGYLQALTKHGLPYRKEYVLPANFEQAAAYKAMRDLLALKNPPTAVFAANDYMALGAISAIHDEGLSVPGHVAVIGFDDLEMPALTFRAPSLTTVRQPIYEVAKEGTESLILLIEGRVTDLRQRVFPSQLIVRSTCGASLKKSDPS